MTSASLQPKTAMEDKKKKKESSCSAVSVD